MERKAYTLVLKGHIALDRATFPKGTSGMALDSLARQFLWEEGLDYRHGTGHGVGSYLVSLLISDQSSVDRTEGKDRTYTKVLLVLVLGLNTSKCR